MTKEVKSMNLKTLTTEVQTTTQQKFLVSEILMSESSDTQVDFLDEKLHQLHKEHDQTLKKLTVLQTCQVWDKTLHQLDQLMQEKHQNAEDTAIDAEDEFTRISRDLQSVQITELKHQYDESASPSAWSHSKICESPIYKNLNLTEYKHFIQICEKNFHINSDTYLTSDLQVAYALQYLDSISETEWSHVEDKETEHTWKKFKEFLLNILKNSVN